MKPYTEDDWRKWAERFGWTLRIADVESAAFSDAHGKIFVVWSAVRQSIDSALLQARAQAFREAAKWHDNVGLLLMTEGTKIDDITLAKVNSHKNSANHFADEAERAAGQRGEGG